MVRGTTQIKFVVTKLVSYVYIRIGDRLLFCSRVFSIGTVELETRIPRSLFRIFYVIFGNYTVLSVKLGQKDHEGQWTLLSYVRKSESFCRVKPSIITHQVGSTPSVPSFQDMHTVLNRKPF